MKFKVGDKVKVTSLRPDVKYSYYRDLIGSIGIISKIEDKLGIKWNYVKIKTDDDQFLDRDLTLIKTDDWDSESL